MNNILVENKRNKVNFEIQKEENIKKIKDSQDEKNMIERALKDTEANLKSVQDENDKIEKEKSYIDQKHKIVVERKK